MSLLDHRHNAWKGRGVVVAVAILTFYVVVAVVAVPAFLAVGNLVGIFFSTALLLPVVMGMQALLLVGHFDLSAGANASFAVMVLAVVNAQTDSVGLALVVAIMVAVVIGMLNGLLVVRMGVSDLIATLAMMGILRSLALAINDGRIIAGLPAVLAVPATVVVLGMPLVVWLALVAFALCVFGLRNVALLRRVYAVGGNREAARNAGIDVDLVAISAFAFLGFAAAVTGVLQASRTLSASPLVFQDLAIDAVAACLIGGSTLAGGRGTLTGAALGLLAVVATRNFVVLIGVPVYWKDFVVGVLLLGAVAIDWSTSRRQVPRHSPGNPTIPR